MSLKESTKNPTLDEVLEGMEHFINRKGQIKNNELLDFLKRTLQAMQVLSKTNTRLISFDEKMYALMGANHSSALAKIKEQKDDLENTRKKLSNELSKYVDRTESIIRFKKHPNWFQRMLHRIQFGKLRRVISPEEQEIEDIITLP